jgi:hypothetical protein
VSPRDLAIAAIGFGVIVGCGSSSGDHSAVITTPEAAAADRRLAELDAAVERWRSAASIADATAAAEIAANLVVGPNGPGYGDRNGDGKVGGATAAGLLPGLDGEPDGLANPIADNSCVERDVLGGQWDEPGIRWGEMTAAIEAWRPDNNTMPTLASHPMRVVGWATFTLDADAASPDALDLAHEYAGHAALHVAISVDALSC